MINIIILVTLPAAGILLALLGVAKLRAELQLNQGKILGLRTEVEADRRKQDQILAAISRIATDLMVSHSLEIALPEALKLAGEAVAVDRVVVLEGIPSTDGSMSVHTRYAWNAPGVHPPVQPGSLTGTAESAAALGTIFSKMSRGQIFMTLPRKLESHLARFLRSLNIQSNLLVPMLVEGKTHGYLAFDDCHSERAWTTSESEMLQVVAGIIGAAIARAQYIAELADAKRIVENSATVLFRCSALPGLPITYISENAAKWGYAPAQLRASPLFNLDTIHPADASQVTEWMKELLADHNPASWLAFRILLAHGGYRWFENHITPIRDEKGALTAFEGMLFDITDRKNFEDKFNFVSTLLQTAIENSPNGFLVVGVDARVLASNRRFFDMWKIPAGASTTKLDGALLETMSAALKHPGRFRASMEHLDRQTEEKLQDEIEFLDGRIFERHAAALRDPNGGVLGRMYFLRDITERKQSDKEMVRLARTDALTGLANRAAFLDRLNLAMAASRRGDTPFAVHYVDLDNFKDVNDTLGHQIGDGLLKAVGGRLSRAVRVTDVIARLGGDEFALLQADLSDPSTAGTLAAKLRAVLAEPFQIEGNVLHITATVGIALFASEITSAAELLAQADRALYRAKEEGGDRYRFHSEELDTIVHERISMAEELRGAIDRNELELYYQPQVAIATGRIVGVEALVRWNHPRRGQLKPGVFLPAAERTGVIMPLGAWVLDNACRQFREWRDQGVAPPSVAVNLSASQLKLGHDLERDVAATLSKWGLAAQDLEFDVPESVLAASLGPHLDVLKKLQELGVRIAIDDFGAEYTSVGRIKSYHVKRLKIAPQFIASMTSSLLDAGAVRMMIHLANTLGIEIVAKSVETAEQQDFLLASAKDAEAQGFLYSEPLPARQATEVLRKRRIIPELERHHPADVIEVAK